MNKTIKTEKIHFSELDIYSFKMMEKYRKENIPYFVYKQKVIDAVNKKAIEIAQRS